MAVTCKQIAEMVGVSRQAAASVLNNAPVCLVSQAKKEQILKLARELNYVHNNAARTLRKGKSGLIGILSGGLHIVRTGQYLIALDKILRENGYLPVILYTRSECDSIASGIRSLVQQNVDGLIINGIPPSDDRVNATLLRLERSGLLDILPTILSNCEYECTRASVGFCYDDVIKKIVERCSERKFENIQLFIRKRDSGTAFKPGDAMRRAAAQLDLPVMPEVRIYSRKVFDQPHLREVEMSGISKTLAAHQKGTLYLCDTGYCAIQTAATLQAHFGGIPEDSGIIAFDHTELCGNFIPGITSVELDFDLLALKSWQLLKECMSSPGIRETIEVQADFVSRKTF